ncbi:tail fiber protein [Ralstonia phage AhaGv]|nr:tail fiber protein [Ralstonia phage AhaGv]
MHLVVRRLENGVDRIESMEIVPRPATFPAHARLLNMDCPRKRDLVSVGLESIGVIVPADAIMMGCVYDDGGTTHIMTWRCWRDARPACPMPRLISCVMENPRSRRVVYAAIVAIAFLTPSPWELGRAFSEFFAAQQTAQSE